MRMIRLLSRLVDVLGDRLLCATAEEMVSYGTKMQRLMGIMKDISETGVDPYGSVDYVEAKKELEALEGELKLKHLDYRVNVATRGVTVFSVAAAASQPGTLPVLSAEDTTIILTALFKRRLGLQTGPMQPFLSDSKKANLLAANTIVRTLFFYLLEHKLTWTRNSDGVVILIPVEDISSDTIILINDCLTRLRSTVQIKIGTADINTLQSMLKTLVKRQTELDYIITHHSHNTDPSTHTESNAVDKAVLAVASLVERAGWDWTNDRGVVTFNKVPPLEKKDLETMQAMIRAAYPADAPEPTPLIAILERARPQ